MKLSCIACFVAISFAFLRNVSGQAFVNLDFENATIVPDPSSSYYPYAVYTSDAIPGWAVTGNFLGPNDILYNDLALGAPSVAILGMNGAPSIGVPGALDGAFSIDLYGGAVWWSRTINGCFHQPNRAGTHICKFTSIRSTARIWGSNRLTCGFFRRGLRY
jgi:hypothetical protein